MQRDLVEIQVIIFKPNYKNPSLNTKAEHALYNTSTIDLTMTAANSIEDIINECGRLCKISPFYIPMFAIWNDDWNVWMKPCSLLDTKPPSEKHCSFVSSKLEFRIRFAVKSELDIQNQEKEHSGRYYLPGREEPKDIMDDCVTEYYFFQQREDFLNDKLNLNSNDSIDAALGVAILDTLRLSKQLNSEDPHRLNHIKYKKLLSKTCKNQISQMTYLQRYRVNRQFRHYLQNVKNNISVNSSTIYRYYKMYLRNLELLSVKTSGNEWYDLHSNQCIEISPDDGIILHKRTEEENTTINWCDFLEVTDLNLEVKIQTDEDSSLKMFLVLLSKLNGEVLHLNLKSLMDAENLASCIDGYYRLLVDPHHYLCKDVAPPSLVLHSRLKCHGPITLEEAKKILSLKKNPVEGDCLIRSSWTKYGEYFINSICSVYGNNMISVKNFRIERQSDGKLAIYGAASSHNYNNLEDLISTCAITNNNSSLPFNTFQLVQPNSNIKTSLQVRRCKDKQLEDDYLYRQQNDHRGAPILSILDSEFDHEKIIGYGNYTEVALYKTKNSDSTVIFKHVVIKPDICNDLSFVECVKESFRDSVFVLNSLEHEHIVKLLGVTVNNMMVLENAIYCSITEYISNNTNKEIDFDWILRVFWQLAHACSYLEALAIAHGKIQGKNILLFVNEPYPQIKLSDPGVTRYRQQLKYKPVLPVPWLAYEFCGIDSISQDYVSSVNGDKWSFATTICEICNMNLIHADTGILTDDLKQKYRTKNVLPIPEKLTENSNLGVLIKNCWDIDGYKRPPYKQILRELGTTLSSCYVHCKITLPSGKANLPQLLPQPFDTVNYADTKLCKIKSLGNGHFGTVDLYRFNNVGRREELVAIKQLKSETAINDFEREFETMKRIKHPYIVQLKGMTVPSKRIVMEYLKRGSLNEALRNPTRDNADHISLRSLLNYGSQIAEAMEYLQSIKIIHRDLALRNILLDEIRRGQFTEYIAKVSDFGLSRFLAATDEAYYSQNLHDIPALWYAPECICENNKKYHFQSDVWSYGVTVWEMFSSGAKPIYPNYNVEHTSQLEGFCEKLKQDNYRLPKPVRCPQNVYTIMQSCWLYNPTDRSTFSQLRKEFDKLRHCNSYLY